MQAFKGNVEARDPAELEHERQLTPDSAFLLTKTADDDIAIMKPTFSTDLSRHTKRSLAARWSVIQVAESSDDGSALCFISSLLSPQLGLGVLVDQAEPAAGILLNHYHSKESQPDDANSPALAYQTALVCSNVNDPTSLWQFLPDGTIRSAGLPDLCLTLLRRDADANVATEVLCVMPMMPSSSPLRHLQHWGFATTSTNSIGLCKLTRDVNSSREWVQQSLLWPCTADGLWHPSLPSELAGVQLITGASWPSINKKDTLNASFVVQVLQCGASSDQTTGISVQRSARPIKLRPRADVVTNTQDTIRWLKKRAAPPLEKGRNQRERQQVLDRVRLDRFFSLCDIHLASVSGPTRYAFTSWGAPISRVEDFEDHQVIYVSSMPTWQPAGSLKDLLTHAEAELDAMRHLHDDLSVDMKAEYIACDARNGHIVLGKSPEDSSIFELTSSRHLVLKSKPDLCLTVAPMESLSAVTLASIDEAQSANQKWVADGSQLASAMSAELLLAIDGASLVLSSRDHQASLVTTQPAEDGGIVLSAVPSQLRHLIASCNRRGVCTAAVLPTELVYQPCRRYNGKLVCLSCANEQLFSSSTILHEDFICERAKEGRQFIQQHSVPNDKTMYIKPMPCLGARADLSTASSREAAIQEWDVRIGKLQSITDRSDRVQTKPRLPTQSLGATPSMNVLMHRNGSVKPSLAIRLVAKRDSNCIDDLLNQATKRLDLPNAARALYVASGKQITTQADLADAAKESSDGVVELWAVMRDDFMDPGQHLDALRQHVTDQKSAYAAAKGDIRNMVAERKAMKEQRAKETNESKQNILDNNIDSLSMEITDAIKQLDVLKQNVTNARDAVKQAVGSKGASTMQTAEIFTRLSKPLRATLRVQARLNGNEKMQPEPCIGTSMRELMQSCAHRLGLRVVKKLYTVDGQRLRKFGDIKQGQEVYASAGEAWVDPVKLAETLRKRE
eukprot:TRINITY_DN12353_c0_g2_i2.p1 TRINITY_DN12353_c0_g2~~TRINITY_DN12353_c0_g2_i2.p1  ORF type:complete len:961 (+),score=166.54 TRINITY_DN12353_c0_g2_i2:44-2926(+)